MSKVNLDIADRLDITCRSGDTFELTLTLKDSSGVGLPLVTDDYSFLMQVKKSTKALVRSTLRFPGGGDAAVGDDAASEGVMIGSAESGIKGPVNFTFINKDDSGNVTVFLSAQDMRKVVPGRYKYDLQYDVGDTQKTILEGSFRVNSDVSKSL